MNLLLFYFLGFLSVDNGGKVDIVYQSFLSSKSWTSIVKYLLYNLARNYVLHKIIDVHGRKTNNEAYYITLVEGLKEEKQNVVNDIALYMNSQLICNQLNDIYEVQKSNLKPLYKEAIMWSSEFNYFSIQWITYIHRMPTHILVEGMSSVEVGVKDDTGSRSIATEVINQNHDESQICECDILIIFLGVIMGWFFH